MQYLILCIVLVSYNLSTAQVALTPDQFLKIQRVSPIGISDDKKQVIYSVSTPDITSNSFNRVTYSVPVAGGKAQIIKSANTLIKDSDVSPNGTYRIDIQSVKITPTLGKDIHEDLDKTNAYAFNSLMYRHWDTWSDGSYDHVMLYNIKDKKVAPIDIMKGMPFNCPTKPFGGSSDYLWHPDGKQVIYVTKKASGTAYAVSTNTDIFAYNIETGNTLNLTEKNLGYDNHPQFSKNADMAYLSMERDGYESDKNDIKVLLNGSTQAFNLTEHWDGTVNEFVWSPDGKQIYFTAPTQGTVQVFMISMSDARLKKQPKQITKGPFDIGGLLGIVKGTLIASRTDMNHAREIYSIDLSNGEQQQLSFVNTTFYNGIKQCDVKKEMIKTTDGKEMLTWVIYPPDFDSRKKYPTLLYCQGGPQGALSQFYSYRWNFQLMASQGYIVVAPNRRGMPGYGVEWNEQISGDYGGQNMNDYLAAIDHMAKKSFVDQERLGCVGASYGGYSAFYLAGIHEGRFRSFIAHDGIFNWRSMYGTTEELFFVNWDLGGAYWDYDNKVAQQSYQAFNPINKVHQWDTPILIIQGGKDFRVPIGQGLEAFQAAQLKGIKSRLLFFPEENHWVLEPQNSLLWHREFYAWLKETL